MATSVSEVTSTMSGLKVSTDSGANQQQSSVRAAMPFDRHRHPLRATRW